MSNLRAILALALDYLSAIGAPAPDDVVTAVKQFERDPREPGRERKARAETRLRRIMERIFARQLEALQPWISENVKATPPADLLDIDPDDLEELADALTEATRDGVRLFGETTGAQIDYTKPNRNAERAARRQAVNLVRDINQTTRDAIRVAVEFFATTEGATIADVIARIRNDVIGQARAEMISVTEITRAYADGEVEAGRELADEFPDVEVVKTWFTNNDDIVCEICGPLDGEEKPLDEPFYEPDEYTDGNPPAHPNCILPGQFVITPGGAIAGVKSFYVGACVEIVLADGSRISVTANHPIATPGGWVAANKINPGSYVITNRSNIETELNAIYPYNNHTPTLIDEVFCSLVKSRGMFSVGMPISSEDFHGDGRSIYGNIDIVLPDGKLRNRINSQFTQAVNNGLFGFVGASLFTNNSSPIDKPGFWNGLSTNGIMSGGDLGGALVGIHKRPLEGFGFGLVADVNSSRLQAPANSPTIDTEKLSNFIFRHSASVQAEKVIQVNLFSYSGHVYDLQTFDELYSVNSIITHNCRCWLSTTTKI